MMKRHWKRPLVGLMAMALVVAACGEPDDDAPVDDDVAADEDEDEDAPPPDEEEETHFEMEATDTPGEDIELSFWTFVDDHAEFLITQAERFNEENEDWNIILDAVSIAYAEMHDRTLVALQAGTGAPDLVDLEISRFATFTRGEVPLLDLGDVLDPYRDELVTERLAPYEVGGVPYGIDYHLGAAVMYYNTEITEAAGVDIDAIETWDDWVEAGLQVVENTDAMWTHVGDIHVARLLQLINGGGLYNENQELILDHPANLEAIEFLQSLVYEHEIAVVNTEGNHDPTFFAEMNDGEYGAVWMPQWYMIRFPDNMPDLEGKVAVRPLPAWEPGGFVSTMGGGTGTAITNQIDEAKIEAAKEFLGFAKLTYEAQVSLWTDLGFDPFRHDVYDDPELAGTDPFFMDEPVMANIADMFDRLAPEYTGPRYPEATTAYQELVLFPVLEEQADPAEALANAQAEIEGMD
jgi:arabinosaccharide transport system substrate-binding protein